MSNTNNTPLSREEIEKTLIRYRSTADAAWSEVKDGFYTQKDYENALAKITDEAISSITNFLKAFADEVERELPDKQFCSISRGCKHRWNDIEEKHMEYVKGFNRARKESVSALKDLKEKWGIDE